VAQKLTLASIDLAVLTRFGHRELANDLWRRGRELDRDSARAARRRVRARFGERSAYGGRLISMLGVTTFLGMTGVLVGILAPTHRNMRHSVVASFADVILLVSVGVLTVVYVAVIVAAGTRPVSSGVVSFGWRVVALWVAALLVSALGGALTVTAIGAGAAVLMTGWLWTIRSRDPVAAAAVDAAPAAAIGEQCAELRESQDRLRREFAEGLAADRADVAQLIEWRTGVAREQGFDDSPDRAPGEAIIAEQSERWLERDRRFAVDATAASGRGPGARTPDDSAA